MCVCARERERVCVCVFGRVGECVRERHLFEQVDADNIPAARKGQ
jgi:hypothetical protein